MLIDSRVWYALPEDSKKEYLRMFGKVEVVFGRHRQEVSLEKEDKISFSPGQGSKPKKAMAR
jgi:hypothetical protein